MKFVVRVVKFK